MYMYNSHIFLEGENLWIRPFRKTPQYISCLCYKMSRFFLNSI